MTKIDSILFTIIINSPKLRGKTREKRKDFIFLSNISIFIEILFNI